MDVDLFPGIMPAEIRRATALLRIPAPGSDDYSWGVKNALINLIVIAGRRLSTAEIDSLDSDPGKRPNKRRPKLIDILRRTYLAGQKV
jgi:hypothetical protein